MAQSKNQRNSQTGLAAKKLSKNQRAVGAKAPVKASTTIQTRTAATKTVATKAAATKTAARTPVAMGRAASKTALQPVAAVVAPRRGRPPAIKAPAKAPTRAAAKPPAKTAAVKAPVKLAAKSPAKAPAKALKPALTKPTLTKPSATKAPVKVAAKGPQRLTAKTPVKPPMGRSRKVQDQTRRVSPSSGYKGVSRIDNPSRNSYGWYVRVRFKGVNYSKFFSDSVHGGSDRGLQRAVRYRNKVERDIGKPRTDRTLIVMPTQNETGMIGVKRTLKGNSPVYEVTWCPEPNVIRRTSVSIRKHGEEEALRRARAIRLLHEKKMYGASIQPDATTATAPPPPSSRRR